jgi:hypothetical protein
MGRHVEQAAVAVILGLEEPRRIVEGIWARREQYRLNVRKGSGSLAHSRAPGQQVRCRLSHEKNRANGVLGTISGNMRGAEASHRDVHTASSELRLRKAASVHHQAEVQSWHSLPRAIFNAHRRPTRR